MKNLLPSTGTTVHLPNLETITSSAAGFLPLHTSVSTAAKLTHVFDDLHSASLLSLGQLCDDGCKVLLDEKNIHVFKNNQIVLTGYRNKRDGLWDVPLPQQQQYMLHMTHNLPKEKEFDIDYPISPLFENLNVIIHKDKTKNELIRHLHACCFSPQVSTFIKATSNGNFLSWPGLTENLLEHFLNPV